MKLSGLRERVAVNAIKLAPKSMYSGFVGWGARRTLPQALRGPIYQVFANAVGAQLNEVEHDLVDYKSLGEFFTRGLKPGARPLASRESDWVAPCDCVVAEAGPTKVRSIEAKGHSFSLSALLGSEELAAKLKDGEFATLYLSPKDYHRVHVPVNCSLISYQYIPGSLFPVGPFCATHIDNIFSKNERIVLELESDAGRFAMVMVGASGVGNLRLREPKLESRHLRAASERRCVLLDEPLQLTRGQEIGAFELGSTVILCTPGVCSPGRSVELHTTIGTTLKFGERIASKSAGDDQEGGATS